MNLASANLVAFAPVSDLGRARSFYEGTLGLKVRQADDYGCMFEANGAVLRLAEVENHDPAPYTVVGWEVASITETVVDLAAAGVAMHRYEGMAQDERGIWTAPSGDRVGWFSDSEGNTLSVTQSA